MRHFNGEGMVGLKSTQWHWQGFVYTRCDIPVLSMGLFASFQKFVSLRTLRKKFKNIRNVCTKIALTNHKKGGMHKERVKIIH